MPQVACKRGLHRNLRVVHAMPGRIRLKATKLRGQSPSAQDLVRRLSAVRGLHHVEANPTTGSLTMHYRPSALDSVEFFAEVAAALGLVAEGIDPGTVKTLFNLMGVSPEDLAQSLDYRHLLVPIATLAVGLYLGRHFA